MRTTRLILTAALLTASFGGCGAEPMTTNDGGGDAPLAEAPATPDESPRFQQVKQEIDDAIKATTQYTSEQKEKYVADLKQRLDDVDASLQELKSDAAKLSEQAEERWQDGLKEIESQRDKLREQLSEMSAASGDAWSELKVGFEQAWQELGKSVDNAAESFK